MVAWTPSFLQGVIAFLSMTLQKPSRVELSSFYSSLLVFSASIPCLSRGSQQTLDIIFASCICLWWAVFGIGQRLGDGILGPKFWPRSRAGGQESLVAFNDP